MFEIMDTQTQEAVIKVIGVGGCGGNAVDHMIEQGVLGVEFICANTDAQALKRTQAKVLLQLGSNITKGLGAGANPEVGRESALEDRERIAEIIDGADMLFITAGMGGGTGTGAAPVVAEIAKELGILTVAVVTKPFAFEGKRMKIAQAGIDALTQHVDSVIVIPNDKLMAVLGEKVSLREAFKAADSVLHGAVAGIAEIIKSPGLINVDFADVRTVMREMGMAMMGSASVSGAERARLAAEQAAASPLLEDVNLAGARGVLVNITANADLGLQEVHEAMNTVRTFTAEDATVIFGTVFDDSLGDALRVTIVATGLGNPSVRKQDKPLQVIKTGTDAAAVEVVNYGELDTPTVMRTGRRRDATVEAMKQSGVDVLDIPAFLRKQAD
ncbi:MAG: cell division protein FtsZ [Betaproteobacteria bacterium]|nr:cell division protein FtsZ [Betaproteobacteria bacterium]